MKKLFFLVSSLFLHVPVIYGIGPEVDIPTAAEVPLLECAYSRSNISFTITSRWVRFSKDQVYAQTLGKVIWRGNQPFEVARASLNRHYDLSSCEANYTTAPQDHLQTNLQEFSVDLTIDFEDFHGIDKQGRPVYYGELDLEIPEYGDREEDTLEDEVLCAIQSIQLLNYFSSCRED